MRQISSATRKKVLSMSEFSALKLTTDSRNDRIKNLSLDRNTVCHFFELVGEVSLDTIKAIPAKHYQIAGLLETCLSNQVISKLDKILKDRNYGAFTITLPLSLNKDEVTIFTLALSYLMGTPRKDNSFNPLAILESKLNDSFLNIDLLRTLPLHNDGTYYNGNTDWLLLALISTSSNNNASLTSLLHIDDWLPKTNIMQHPLFYHKFLFEGPHPGSSKKSVLGSRKDIGVIKRKMFYEHEDYGVSSRIAHQWVHPSNRFEAEFINFVLESLNTCQPNTLFEMIKNEIYVINNHIWLHGRMSEKDIGTSSRVAIRSIGEFDT